MSTSPSAPQPALAYETPQTQWSAVAVGAVALKLLGVYCFVLATPIVSFVFYLPRRSGTWTYYELAAGLVAYGMYVAVGALLIWFAYPLAMRLFGHNRRDPFSDDAPAQMSVGPYLQAVAFSVVGAWIAIEAVSACTYAIIQASRGGKPWEYFAPPLVKAAMGVALFLGAPGLARLWHKLRTGGIIRDQPISPGRQP